MLTMPFALPTTSVLLMAAWPVYVGVIALVAVFVVAWRAA